MSLRYIRMEIFHCDFNHLSGFWLFSAYAGDVSGRKGKPCETG